MSQQFAEKIGDLLTQEGLLTAEQLAKSIAIQKQQDSAEPIGKVCVSLGFVAPTDLEKLLVKHRRRIPLGELLVHLRTAHAEPSTKRSRPAERIEPA